MSAPERASQASLFIEFVRREAQVHEARCPGTINKVLDALRSVGDAYHAASCTCPCSARLFDVGGGGPSECTLCDGTAAVSRRALDAYRSAYIGGLERAALAPHWRRLPDYVVACPRASLGCGHACARSRVSAHLQGECAHGRVRLAFADDAVLRRARQGLRPTVLDDVGSEYFAVPRRLGALPPQHHAEPPGGDCGLASYGARVRTGHGSPALHRPQFTLSSAIDPPDEAAEASQVSKKKPRRRPKKKRNASAAPLPDAPAAPLPDAAG
ncbi:hypothetical protein M885DRAFT_626543 [Pelagophyceae sp. CCMP2097]|nr:hypothetical protein M885DRAFT_626543 [Pelagophyceae sp. CCMP2097]